MLLLHNSFGSFRNPYTFRWIDGKVRDRKDAVPIDIPRYITSVASEAHFNGIFSINKCGLERIPDINSKTVDHVKCLSDTSDTSDVKRPTLFKQPLGSPLTHLFAIRNHSSPSDDTQISTSENVDKLSTPMIPSSLPSQTNQTPTLGPLAKPILQLPQPLPLQEQSLEQQHLQEVQSQPQQLQPFTPLPISEALVKQVPELGRFAVFDCEWYRDDLKENREKGIAGNMYTFCLVSSLEEVRLHVNDFTDRHAFMSTILETIENYDTLAGYAILNSKSNKKKFIPDLGHITANSYQVGLRERFSSIKAQVIDANEIFSNNVIKGFLKATYAVTYRGGLDEVAEAYIDKGKLEGISGLNAESLPRDKQLDYCLKDAQLCYELLQKNNFELLHIMYEISQEIKLPFFETCNTQFPTKWWKSKLASIDYQKPAYHIQQWIDENTTFDTDGKKSVKYLGGYVAEPRVGFHINAASYDVSSMYPTMIVRHNISTDTVNCSCCKDDPNVRVPNEVMKFINDYVMDKENKAKKQEPRPWHYWICQKRGQLSEVMLNLMERKKQYKKSGQKLKEKATKILMNSGYGCFGNAHFEYRDVRVAELITGYGQYTIKELEKYADNKMIYGDTDSIYLESKDDTIITKAAELGVTLEFETLWKGLFLTSNKKQYFGLTQEGKAIHKILKGMKSDQPAYFNEVTKKLVSKEFMELFINANVNASTNFDSCTNSLSDVVDYVRLAFIQLPNANLNELQFSQDATSED